MLRAWRRVLQIQRGMATDPGEGVLFNSTVGGWRELRRRPQAQRPPPESLKPLSLDFLSPEAKARLLGHDVPSTPAPSIDLTRLATRLKGQPRSQVQEDFGDAPLLDFMTSQEHDPRIPPSRVPCGGCGAFLHCMDPEAPGFVPAESFEGVSPSHLRSLICQRCYVLKHFKRAVRVKVSPDEYPRILAQIRERRALVLLLVDLTDFPCSVWPHLNEIIGTNRPIVIVGNKVDLLPMDGKNFLQRIEEGLRREVTRIAGLKSNHIKHVALVSAKTGYGIEQLINKLHAHWSIQGDVYLVGCTNVGKSSIFNALLSSDYCKVQASDLVQRATISNWPGTTLNLLKFPIMRPSPKLLFDRVMRLRSERLNKDAEQKEQEELLRKTRDPELSILKDSVGKTYELNPEVTQDPFSVSLKRPLNFIPEVGIDPGQSDFRDSRWCYDTPGVVYPEQVINILNEEELNLVLPSTIISPQSLTLKVGQTLFLAGLGRIDYLGISEGTAENIILTVFASSKLPLTVCWTKSADAIYKSYLGSEKFMVPCGDEKRLSMWPGLTKGSESRITGLSWRESAADIVLSSAGWVSVTAGLGSTAVLAAHTPLGLGLHLRQPALLPYAVTRRGRRIERTPLFEPFRPIVQKK